MGTYRFCQDIQALVTKAAPWLSTTNEDACAIIDNQIEYLPFPRFLESASDDIGSLLQTLEEDSATQEVKDVYERVAGFLKATYSRIAHGSLGIRLLSKTSRPSSYTHHSFSSITWRRTSH
jgi:hypothetical protein